MLERVLLYFLAPAGTLEESLEQELALPSGMKKKVAGWSAVATLSQM